MYIYIYTSGFIQALLPTAVFPQRFNFLTVRLVHCLHEVSPGWTAKEKKLKFRSPDCWKMLFWCSFWLQNHSLYIVDKHDFFSEYQLRIPPFCHVCIYILLSAVTTVFCWNFRVLQGMLKKSWQERYHLSLCLFVGI